jgi:hypothetical protein
MKANPSCSESNCLKRTLRYSSFVWAAILFYCFTAIAQADSGAGDNKYLIERVVPKKALVIVAANYVNIKPIPSASLDGRSVTEKLKKIGFKDKDIITSFNDPADIVWEKIRTFSITLTEGDLAVVYFSGHGFQHNGLNYFAPVDIPLVLQENTDDLTKAVVPISSIVQRISEPNVGLGLIILDACRDNTLNVKTPEGILKGVGQNRLGPQIYKGRADIMTAFAADFGQSAQGSENPNQNSLYTKHLVEKIDIPGKDIIEIMRIVNTDLRRDCRCNQDPRLDVGHGTFYPMPSKENKEFNKKTWYATYYSKEERDINLFLQLQPVSEYSASARQWLKENSSRVPSGSTFAIRGNTILGIIPWGGYSVIKWKDIAAPMVATTKDPSKGQSAIVAVDNMKVFSQPIASAEQIATLPIGKTVWIPELSYSEEKSDQGTTIWSKVSYKTGKDSQLVGYVKDAVSIDKNLQYKDIYVIKLKPTKKADLLKGNVLVSALGMEDLSQSISLIDAIASQSSGPLNKSILSQSSILVKLHNYIEGTRSVQEAQMNALLRKIQIRNALIGSGAKKENIFIEEPEIFLLGDKGKPAYDEVSIFLAK